MNTVRIEPTKFVDVRDGIETFGYRIFDSYGSAYDNTLKSTNVLPSTQEDDLELLKIVVENDNDVIQDMLEHLVETENGLEIGVAYYSFEKIKHIIS